MFRFEILNAAFAAGFDAPRLTGNPRVQSSTQDLLLEMDRIFREMAPHAKLPALTILAEKLISKHSDFETSVQNILGKHGYQFEEGAFVPIGILDARERQYLPAVAASNLEKAMERLGSGDYTGAITSACGAVDSILRAIYQRDHLGGLSQGYVQKVTKVFFAPESIPRDEK